MSASPSAAHALDVTPPHARESCATTLLSNVRSEGIRLIRPGFLGIGLLIVAVLTALSTLVTFLAATDQPGAMALLTPLEEPGGIVEAVKSAANFLGIVVLSWAAVAVASDYSSGLIRLLVQAEPRRWRLMAGKLIALAALTIGASALATIVTLVASPIVAQATEVSTSRWGIDSLGAIATTFINLSLGLLVWTALGFMIAVVTRSTPAAIAGGIAYMLVIENLLGALHDSLTGWLPAAAIQAVVAGGNETMSYERALLVSLGYALIAVVVSLVVFQRRDITS